MLLEEWRIPKGAAGSRPALAQLKDEDCHHSAAAAAAGVLQDLGDNDALLITEDDTYQRCEALAAGFLKLPGHTRAQAVDVLAANLATLCTSAQLLLSGGGGGADEGASSAAALRHRNGLKMCVHLLHTIAMQAERDAEKARGTENAAAKPAKAATGRGRKGAAAADDADAWDWQASRQRVLHAVHDVMRVDLRALFKGLAAAERMVNLCMELALQALESPAALKPEGAWPAVCDVLVRGAVHHEQLDFVAASLMERCRKHEHVPPLAAHAAKYAEGAFNSTQLAVKLLGEFWALSPDDYDAQYATNSVSVRLAGELVVALADLLPKVVSNHISQLRPYLACGKAHCLRGALLAATGSVLVQVFPTEALSSSLGAGAAQAHLRSKEALLSLLHTRVLDKAALVRQKVLQTWARLVEESCVPLSHWNTLLAQAIARLEDESQLVVRAALQLLRLMVAKGIFQPPLKAQTYINTLRAAEAELAALPGGGRAAGKKQRRGIGEGAGGGGDGSSSDDEDDDDEGAQDGDAAAPGGEGQAGADNEAVWAGGDLKMEQAEEAGADGSGDDGAAAGQGAGAAAADASKVTRLRTLIATLKEGASFCKRLTACLAQVQVLLASPVAAVVHDAIVFLTTCKVYEVEGAAKALRGMWPLVFSKQDAVRQTVLESWHVLHLHDKTAKEQLVELLTNVVPNSSLSELAALETILSTLVQQDKLAAPKLVRHLAQDICHYFTRLQSLPQDSSAQTQDADEAMADAAAPASDAAAGAGGDDASPSGLCRADCVELLRHFFALLSLLTAAQPSVLDETYVQVLLEVGFSSSLADAWVARHTCLCLRHAAPHLVPCRTAGAAAAPAALAPEVQQQVLAALVRLLVAPPAASLAPNWPSAAEPAVAALYVLSPAPQELLASVLEEMFTRCRPGSTGPQGEEQQAVLGFSAAALSRFFFVLGRTGLHHLLHIEQLGKAIRAARLAASRAAAEASERAREAAASAAAAAAKPGKRGGKAAAAAAAAAAQQAAADDIGSMLGGAGAVAAEAELDDLSDMLEAQILAKDQLLGRYGALLSKMAHLRAFVDAFPPSLQAAALLALTQLMAVDAAFCNDNVALLFTLLYKRLVPTPVRVNMVVSLADLASRFPNVLEPWTAYIYEPLSDPEPAVKLAALSSLTHLVLGGMVKAKGNVAKVATLLVDDCQELVDRAVLFFESLAASGSGSSRSAGSAAAGASSANPVYNLLPDCLSALLARADPPLRDEQMQVIMSQLLGYVRDKQAESLRERLVARLQQGGPREWRLVAWCIAQLGYSEKGLRRVMELAPCYRHTLGEQQVFDVFMALADKARKATGGKAGGAAAAAAAALGPGSINGSTIPGLPGDFRSSVEEWLVALGEAREAALEAADVEAMTAGGPRAAAAGAADEPAQAREDEEEQEGDAAAATGAGDADMQQPAADGAAAAADEGEQQIVLVQSQDLAGHDDDAALLEAAASAAASGLQRLNLKPAGKSQRASAVAAGSSSRPATGRQPRKGMAAAAGGGSSSTRASRGASATSAAAARRKAVAAPASEGSSSSSGGDDDSIEDASSDGSDGERGSSQVVQKPAGSRAVAPRGSRSSAAAPAAAAGRSRLAVRAPPAPQADSSSSEDDD